jgi:uncharacterized protein YyaL (SSP411 family)
MWRWNSSPTPKAASSTDGATPSGNSAVIEALITQTALTGAGHYRAAAESALARVAPIVVSHPRFAGLASACAEALIDGPVEIAIVGDDGTLTRAAWRAAPPGAVIVAGVPDQDEQPLLADRTLIDGRPTAYVCRGFVCELPTTDVDGLIAQLARSR